MLGFCMEHDNIWRRIIVKKFGEVKGLVAKDEEGDLWDESLESHLLSMRGLL